MKFGIFYEHQLPKPWSEDDEFCLLRDALDQVVADDAVEHLEQLAARLQADMLAAQRIHFRIQRRSPCSARARHTAPAAAAAEDADCQSHHGPPRGEHPLLHAHQPCS